MFRNQNFPPNEMASMQFAHEFTGQYFQTRQMNLRCFPTCDVHHFEKTFCGNNIKVNVANMPQLNERSFVFGEFRLVSSPRSFSVGDAVTSRQLEPDSETKWMMGKLVETPASNSASFLISPPSRRWPCDLPRNSAAIFSVYLVVEDRIAHALDSPSFIVYSKRHKMMLTTSSSSSSANNKAADDGSESPKSVNNNGTGSNISNSNTTAKEAPLVLPQQALPTQAPAQAAAAGQFMMPNVKQEDALMAGMRPPFPPLHVLFPTYTQSLLEYPVSATAAQPQAQAAATAVGTAAQAAAHQQALFQQQQQAVAAAAMMAHQQQQHHQVYAMANPAHMAPMRKMVKLEASHGA